MENINNRITELEKTKSEQEIIKKYKTEITLGKDICNSNNCYDIGKFSKILAIKGMGRNNLFEWMKYKGILMKNNIPYQQHIKANHFIVKETVIQTGEIVPVTYVTGKGLNYIRKRLEKAQTNN